MDKDLINRFEHLIALVNQAVENAQGGRNTDLDNLNTEVNRLCEDVKQANPESAPEIRKRMVELIGRLDDLSLKLTELKSKLVNGH